MPLYPFNNNPFRITHPKYGSFSFVPKGKMLAVSGRRMNPADEWLTRKSPSYAARMFVGLSVGNKGTYTVAHVISLVRAFLRNRKPPWPEDSSFIAQVGAYTEEDRRVTVEKSVQVVLFKDDKHSEPDFADLVLKLGEHICAKMKQKHVLADYQRNGISKHVWNIYK